MTPGDAADRIRQAWEQTLRDPKLLEHADASAGRLCKMVTFFELSFIKYKGF
jgi:hypothetical protein